MSKPGKVLKGLCKKLGVRLTVKRNGKRVYKSIKVLKAQCKRKKAKKKKKKKKKKKVRRKRRFGTRKIPSLQSMAEKRIAEIMTVNDYKNALTYPKNDPRVKNTIPYYKEFLPGKLKKLSNQRNRSIKEIEQILQTFSIREDYLLKKVLKPGAQLQKAKLNNVNFEPFSSVRIIDLSGANLKEANLNGAVLTSVKLNGANLQKANLQNAKLHMAKLQGADLRDAKLQDADLEWANLKGANLSGAYLDDAGLQNSHLQGAEFKNSHLQRAYLGQAKLQGAYFEGADLKEAELKNADLRGADLRQVNLQNADLRGVNLQGAWLSYADLRGVNLQGTNLQGAILEKAIYNDEPVTIDGVKYEETKFPNFFNLESSGMVKKNSSFGKKRKRRKRKK